MTEEILALRIQTITACSLIFVLIVCIYLQNPVAVLFVGTLVILSVLILFTEIIEYLDTEIN